MVVVVVGLYHQIGDIGNEAVDLDLRSQLDSRLTGGSFIPSKLRD